MKDEEVFNVLAKAITTEPLQHLSVDELGELVQLAYFNDPDVEFGYEFESFDAGAEAHGENTEEEMMVESWH